MSFNVKHGMKDRVLEDQRMLKNTLVQTDPQCFSECSKDCRCMSFNVCGQTCQLNGANRFLHRNSLRIKEGCRYYDMPQAKSNCGTPSSKPPGICCARLSPPCYNGGTCDVNITDITRRFRCKCPAGFYGDQCQITKPKACLDYWTDPIKPISREYAIVDESGNPYKVFCDFDSENGVAWTLFESFSMSNEAQLYDYPLTLDHPLNEHSLDWELFRLPKNVMLHIRSRSKYWRGTCSFLDYGVDYRDYARVRMSELDPTTFLGGVTYNSQSCIVIDFIDVKGTSCVNCTTPIFQKKDMMLHIGIAWGTKHGCNFDSSSIEYQCPGTNQKARLLGVYQ